MIDTLDEKLLISTVTYYEPDKVCQVCKMAKMDARCPTCLLNRNSVLEEMVG